MQRRKFLAGMAGAIAAPMLIRKAGAQGEPIRLGGMYTLTGGGAVFGSPAMLGHQMAVEEINANGGIMGRMVESIERDDKGNPSAASATMKELITRDKVDMVLGGLGSAVGLAMSEVARQEQKVYIATLVKTIQLTTDKLHPYVFRTATNTDYEGEALAMLAGKQQIKKACMLQLDYSYGHDLEAAILKMLPKYAPDLEIVLTLKPKLGTADFNAFIPQVLASGCDGVLSGLWGPNFITWAKQAQPLGFFDNLKWISGGDLGSYEIAGELKGDYPDNVFSNAYELWYHSGSPAHQKFHEALAKRLGREDTPQWAMLGYVGVMFAKAAIEKAGSLESEKVAKALEGLIVETPVGPLTIDAKTHQANIGMFYGPMIKKPDLLYRVMEPADYIQPTA